jgi:RNA polymerase subunit RPABC4/transcription elongation factor Spt4
MTNQCKAKHLNTGEDLKKCPICFSKTLRLELKDLEALEECELLHRYDLFYCKSCKKFLTGETFIRQHKFNRERGV